MRRNLLIAAVLVAVVVAGVAVFGVSGRRPEWTTSSPEALAEFQKGLDATQKLYAAEARAGFAKALDADPNFVMAKYFLWATKESEAAGMESDKVLDDLKRADLSKLTARERFLIQFSLSAHASKDAAGPEKILAEYAAKHPDDPYALEREANFATARQDWPEAHRLLAHLIEVAPNRVTAYNQLGYLEMGQGRFAEAQKMFETYRYIAPDQANPHDSLGELYILLGRYSEARTELEAALRIKPDFCASYEHLVRLALLEGNPDLAEKDADRAVAVSSCKTMSEKGLRCVIAAWRPLLKGDWEGARQAGNTWCPKVSSPDDPLRVWMGLRTGRPADVDAAEAQMRARLDKIAVGAPGRGYYEAYLAHAEGARLFVGGEYAKAAERFRFADRSMSYRGLLMGLDKLCNKVMLAEALDAAGSRQEGAAALNEARAVNAGFVDLVLRVIVPPAA